MERSQRNKKTMPEGMAKRFDPEGETTGDESNRREKLGSMSGGLFVAVANECPIDIGAQLFAADTASRFTLDIDRQLFAAELSINNVSEMPKGRSAAGRKTISLIGVHRKIKGFQFHAFNYIHRSVLIEHVLVNIFSPDGVAK